ncbi:hypothetical protein [Paenibacillus sinopodophylli]|uniref:hypothetical protein n=1 Tax=Paenibacillus sinopodophylli TaxID=1837342 RepID=UPI00110CC370|nr:hypothetical protein [Paenibacillus sinopodophylli]
MAFIPRIISKFLDLANLQRHNDNFSDIKTELDKHDLHVASKSNPHEVTVVQIGAETPAGAQAKATVVQNNLNTHTSNSAIHTTQSEKDKLAGIAAGAEVNQNSFSKVAVAGQSDVDADSKTDTLTIAGGTGITVTTNPTTDTVTIIATGTATPGAHASSHITGGTDIIPNAVASGNSGLMSGADKSKLDGVATAAGTAGSATDTVIGNRTIDDTVTAATGADTPTRLWSKLANMIKAITGKAIWYIPPVKSIEQLNKDLNDVAGARTGVLQNALINGNIDVWQRGTSFTNPATGTYTTDRFKIAINNLTGVRPTNIIHSRQTLTPGDIPNANYFYRVNTNGAGTGPYRYQLNHLIENGIKLLCGAGKKLTFSFYARSTIAGKKIGVSLVKNYGSGGTPSAVETIAGNNFTLTSSWQKFTVAVDTNTLVGKEFGTNNDDSLILVIAYAWDAATQANYAASSQETFVGSGDIDIAQVQVNAGDTALPFQPRSFAEELALCQRYYFKSFDSSSSTGGSFCYSAAAATVLAGGIIFPVTMRTIPTLVLSQNGVVNQFRKVSDGALASATGISVDVSTKGLGAIGIFGTTIAVSAMYQFDFTADAEL